MISEKQLTRGGLLALALGLGVLAFRQSGAHADGIPGMSPMTYAGTLEEAGGQVTGARNLRLTVWDDATSTESSHTRCITAAPGTPVVAGRFQVVLDNACTSVVRSTPDLWLEIEVAGASLGRTKLSAVPFAVEAGRAADLTPAARNILVPVGTIVAFGGPVAPDGWLLCDGHTISRATYQALFGAIGTSHGGGDGASTFNLPDLRGRFLRGADLGAGRDPDRASRIAANPGGNIGDTVGTLESFATAMPNTRFGTTSSGNHTHTFGVYGATFNDGNAAASSFNGYALHETRATSPAGDHVHTITGGDSESRPSNIAVNYIVKF
jgi:microcystin-dependent protein